jgi:glycosyltransferase involved in cell wall biosynthesis
MTERVLFLSGPVEPPWTRSDKNLVRGVAANLQRYRARVLTHEGAVLPDAHVETESVWGPRLGGHTPLGRRLGLFARLLDQREVALAHLFWPSDTLVATMVRTACRMRGLPVVHTLVKAPRTTVGIRSGLGGNPVVCLTDETRRRLQQEDIPNVRWVPPGIALAPPVEPGDHAAIRRKYRIPLDLPVIIYAGDYAHSNAARTVAAAMPRILREEDVHFVLACRIRGDHDAHEEAQIKAAIAADGIAEHVTFLNEVSSLRELFAVSSVQVFPADRYHEKMELPMVLLEGMAERLATVVAQKPPLTELAEQGGAMAVPPMDPVGLAVAVVGLVRAPDKRVALGLAGRKLVAERHDVRNVAAQYEAIYDEMLAGHQASRAATRKGFRISGGSPWL